MIKTYVLDTNVLLSDSRAIFAFEEHNVIVPMLVLEELDRHKNKQDDVGKNARDVSRSLDKLRTKQGNNLMTGVKLRSGGILRIVAFKKSIPNISDFDMSKVDNMIISFMKSIIVEDGVDSNAVLVSKDVNVRIKCDGLGIPCEDYRKLRAVPTRQEFYRGVDIVTLDDTFVESIFANGSLMLPKSVTKKRTFYPNQVLVLKSMIDENTTLRSAMSVFKESNQPVELINARESIFNLHPRNKEQVFSLDLLMNPDIKLVTLTGPSGTGKTSLALAAALEQLKGLGSDARYKKFIVTRPVQAVGNDIGFLPGTIDEKMQPWIAPIRDNLNFLMGDKPGKQRRGAKNAGKSFESEPYLSLMQQHGLIEIEAIPYIRGRSIPNSFIIIDEAQNLSIHELKTIITRVGEGTKLVLTGDIEQIDNAHLDMYTNGLSYAIEKFKNQKIAAHITLLKGERSELATIASQIL